MAYPPAYVRAYSFTDFETLNPGEPKPGDKLDTEYDAVSNALTATQTALALIQRADGALANESVGEDQLQAGLFDAIGDAAVADAEAAAAAAAASASAAAGSASSASASASAASASAATASGAAAQAGVSQGIAQSAANDAALSAADSFDSAQISANAGNEAQGFRNEAEGFTDLAFKWAELLTGPVLPAPPGWPEAVDDGMFSSKWWAIRAREYNSTTTIDLGTAGADIGEAFDIWAAIPGNELGVGQTYATWGSPVQTYVLIDRSNPSDPASWQNITGGPGPPGPANTLTVGTVTTGAPGSSAVVTITGTSPNQVLDMSIPRGDVGATGGPGPAGPPNALAIGTVTTVPDGTPSGATITGTAPTQTLNLTLTAGPQGIQGIQGIPGPAGPAVNLANPTGTIGLTAVNGSATTAPRSDSAPALSQAIVPTWTGSHTFSNTTTLLTAASPQLRFNATGQAADEKMWVQQVSGKQFLIRSVTDAGGTPRNAIAITKGTGNSAVFLEFGNATDNTNYFFLGTGPVQVNGSITVPVGSQLQPSYGFTADTDSGIWQSGAGHVNISCNNTDVIDVAVGSTEINNRLEVFHSSSVVLTLGASGAGVDSKRTAFNLFNAYTIGSASDAAPTTIVNNLLSGVRSGTAWTALNFGNTTNNPTYSFLGTGALTVGGSIDAGGNLIGHPAVFAIETAVTTKIQSINSTLSGMVGTQSNHPLEMRTNNTIRALWLADGSALNMSTAIREQNGTAAAPSYSWVGETGMGFFRDVAGSTSFASSGTKVLAFALQGILNADGSAAAPSYSFLSDTDTGMFRSSADSVGFATGGVSQVLINNNAVIITGAGGTGGSIYLQDKSASNPSIAFLNDQDSGIYRAGGDDVGVAAGGVAVAHFTSNAGLTPQLRTVDGTNTNPGIAFHSDPNTGFYRWGADAFAATSNGAAVMSWRLGQSRITDGSAVSPALCFENDTDCGIFLAAANRMGFATGGQIGAWLSPPSGSAGGGWVVGGENPTGFFSSIYIDYVAATPTGRLGVINGAGATGPLLLAVTTCTAPSFITSSSRSLKRETGAPRKPANILARLRPLLYRLLDGDDREQLGLIAEEVHEVCPQLSDGKTVAYDRLAILLLAAWQDEHLEAA